LPQDDKDKDIAADLWELTVLWDSTPVQPFEHIQKKICQVVPLFSTKREKLSFSLT